MGLAETLKNILTQTPVSGDALFGEDIENWRETEPDEESAVVFSKQFRSSPFHGRTARMLIARDRDALTVLSSSQNAALLRVEIQNNDTINVIRGAVRFKVENTAFYADHAVLYDARGNLMNVGLTEPKIYPDKARNKHRYFTGGINAKSVPCEINNGFSRVQGDINTPSIQATRRMFRVFLETVGNANERVPECKTIFSQEMLKKPGFNAGWQESIICAYPLQIQTTEKLFKFIRETIASAMAIRPSRTPQAANAVSASA